ncbi:hypothetical protein SLA2020_145300 [Shorea laevis]
MISRSSSSRRSRDNGSSSANRSLQIFLPERHTDLVRRQGGLLSVPKILSSAPLMVPVTDGTRKMTKLLLKVHIEGSLGPVHVVLPPESSVSDLIKAATQIHVKEKRRPLLKESDPNSFELHYSQFSLESLRPEEKLINLGSRNFFLCSRPPASSANSCSSDEAEKASQFHLSLTKLTEYLL